MLFLVLDISGNVIGHIGYTNSIEPETTMEICNVIRGAKNVHPGIMMYAMIALMKWADYHFSPRHTILYVISDNQHAIRFYEQLGFYENGREPINDKWYVRMNRMAEVIV